jgi:hypothetical protein
MRKHQSKTKINKNCDYNYDNLTQILIFCDLPDRNGRFRCSQDILRYKKRKFP